MARGRSRKSYRVKKEPRGDELIKKEQKEDILAGRIGINVDQKKNKKTIRRKKSEPKIETRAVSLSQKQKQKQKQQQQQQQQQQQTMTMTMTNNTNKAGKTLKNNKKGPTQVDMLINKAKKQVAKQNDDRFKQMLRRQLNRAGFVTLSETFVDQMCALPTAKKINAMRELQFDDERIQKLFTSSGYKIIDEHIKQADALLVGKRQQQKATNSNNKNNPTGNGTPRSQRANLITTGAQSLPSEGYAGSSKNKNQLVLSTSVDSNSAKILNIYNLTLGVDQLKLKEIIEEYGRTELSRVVVRDLPTGTAMASVHLAHPEDGELIRLQKFFNGATVDGRTIKVLISEDPVAKGGLV
ncbi:Uncharacterized protein RNJ44_04373 [Nakaseomyces bracarensis]|uniref:RRM domain-containing protein n=1 Tax=Nakaseomyces bracarensis TaxID=273131 RepID=A0ABR4NV03_9SACH